MRPAAVAGQFYPADPEVLQRDLRHLLADAERRLPADLPVPAALILPHAGYVYSGSTAALGYALLARAAGRTGRVVLLGPTHRVPVEGLALPGAAAMATPLGLVRVEVPDGRVLATLPQVVEDSAAHALEHSLEVHLPFLQVALGDVAVVPFAVGRASPTEVAAVLDAVRGGPESVVVVSSDLSHYLPYALAEQVDRETVDQVLRLAGPLDGEQACGAAPVNGLLVAARRRGLVPRLLGRCSSGDTAGDRRRVVGYAAIAFDRLEQ